MHTRNMIVYCLLMTLALCTPAAAEWGGKKSAWKGFDRYDFKVAGKACYVVVPATPAKGNPWVWRARFPSYHAEPDVELVKRGFHIAHMNTGGLLGSPAAMADWDKFYELLTTKHDMAAKPAIIAVSRGGLFAYRWAARNPEKVACIYADTPVCDFKSWPLGRGKGIGSKNTWAQLLKVYGISEKQALAWRENPIDVLKPIAAAKVPLMHIVSDGDRVVPPAENTDVLAKRYMALGGNITVTRVTSGTKKSNGHHFPMTPAHVKAAVKFISDHASSP